MPTHHSLGPDDGCGIKNARAATIEPDEQGAVGPTQMQSAWRALLEDIELMPKDQDFGFQPRSGLEAVAQHTDEEEGNCDHQPQSCSDSAAAVTPTDGVFGSDREAYDRARQSMQDWGQPEIINETVAKRIIEVAQQGESDPDQICELALKSLGFSEIYIGDSSDDRSHCDAHIYKNWQWMGNPA